MEITKEVKLFPGIYRNNS